MERASKVKSAEKSQKESKIVDSLKDTPSKANVKTAKKDVNTNLNSIKSQSVRKVASDIIAGVKTGDVLRDDVRVVFKKALTDREQKVFDYFSEHENEVVYAKDLAVLLNLPRDYVYKYIKNLRAKIEGEKLENADKGGFILKV